MTGNPTQDKAWADYDSAWNEYDGVKKEMDAKGGPQTPQDFKRLKQARDNKDKASKKLSKTSFGGNKAGSAQSKCPWGNTKQNLAKAFGPEKAGDYFSQFQQKFDDPAVGEQISEDFVQSRKDLQARGLTDEQALNTNQAMWEGRGESIDETRPYLKKTDKAYKEKMWNVGGCEKATEGTVPKLKRTNPELDPKYTPSYDDKHAFVTVTNNDGEKLRLDSTSGQFADPKTGGPQRQMVFTEEEHDAFLKHNKVEPPYEG